MVLKSTQQASPFRARIYFANALSEEEAKELYETFAVPASGEPLFQAAAANLNPWTEAKVNSKKPRARPAAHHLGSRQRVAGGRGHRARVRETLHTRPPPSSPLRGSRPGGRGSGVDMVGDDERRDDERLLARAEEVLTEIKVSAGLSEPHAAVLAALRIRLKGDLVRTWTNSWPRPAISRARRSTTP